MFLNIQIYFIILKTYDPQFTLTTKKSLHIIFNVFKLHVYTVCLIECFATYSAITAYLLTAFTQVCCCKCTIKVILKHYMIVCSSTAILTYAVKLDASDVISEVFSD